ncbi:trimeric LpxA-like protein [Clathrospora elynae]|uniref:Trimeric LpxA-like protein n=1 Tax=Clathrospora elynae TaxID=706981 RepID=A0A6A5SSY8_9PLEO|nr:trimeric LpxA-like protein [Clathrospora elynae]
MSAVLHMHAFNSAPYGPAFTSVNGRSSLSPIDEQKPPPLATEATNWSPVSRPAAEIAYHSLSSESSISTASSGEKSPETPNKRRRSVSEEEDRLQRSPDETAAAPRQLPRPYLPANRDGLTSMEAPQRNLPPLTRPEGERRWATEPRELPHNSYQEFQHREPRPERLNNGMLPISPTRMDRVGESLEMDDTNAMEVTRAGVQVELKKRKRQFANRTKTGCGTCRHRKKKCDEAKPECNNCTRGGFVCQGYANKIPWPKNGTAKPPPPLQAKEQLSVEVASAYARCSICNQIHIPHCEAPRSTQNSYPPENHLSNGQGPKVAASSTWKNNAWSEQAPPPPRASYQPEAQAPRTQYTQPLADQERHPSHDRQAQQHNPRIYHHTTQSMAQVVASTPAPAMAAKAITQQPQVAQQHTRPPPPPPPASSSIVHPTTAPPGPPPTHYTQPPPIMNKSEKEKMLTGLPFLPFDRQLMDERKHCTGAVYMFNSTANPAVSISDEERRRYFKTIVAARWIPPRNKERHIVGHFGGNVNVSAPFYCDYGYNLSIADNVVVGADCQLLDSARICIGRNTRIGARVTISTLKTPVDTKALKGSNGTEVAQEVWIGENVYIGDNCMIEAGVRIGDGAIVRPGSVVIGDLPRDCVVRGNPAFG